MIRCIHGLPIKNDCDDCDQGVEIGTTVAPIPDDLVERCAVAAFCAATGASEIEWRGIGVDHGHWRRIARAVLEAAR